jgi:hypothetical protein
MKYIYLLYLVPAAATMFASYLYRTNEIRKMESSGLEFIPKRFYNKIEENLKDGLRMALVPGLNIVTTIIAVLYIIHELLEGIDNVIESGFKLWERIKNWRNK